MAKISILAVKNKYVIIDRFIIFIELDSNIHFLPTYLDKTL